MRAVSYALLLTISIHTLRVEGDGGDLKEFFTDQLISIHTLRVEGDFLL